MEGRGPGSGKPRFFGLIGASADAVALDAALAPMMGLPAENYAPLAAARARGIGDCELNGTEWLGDFDPGTRFENVDIPALDALSLMPRFMDKLGRALLASRPAQDESRCMQCGRYAAVCPAGALVLDGKKLRFDYSKCIRCYCCHEMCPHDAILFREGPLMRLFKALGIARR